MTVPMPRYAWQPVGAVAFGVFALLVALAGRYGYHRDELYYLVAGRHPDWGYDDQPAFTPLLARLMDMLAPGNLTVLRLPSALAVAGIVLLVAGIARYMGADQRVQVVAALIAASAPFVMSIGHIVSTTTFDMLFSTLLAWLVARWIRTGEDRLLLLAGVVTGVGLHNKMLIAFVAAALVLAFPRMWRRPALWLGAATAVALWAPNLWWQAAHGWPQWEMAGVIADREPGGGRILMLPMQFVLLGVALVWLARWQAVPREFRGFAVAYLVLLGTFLVTGGQFYYPAGATAALMAAAAVAVTGRAQRGRAWWQAGPVRALGVQALVTVLMTLPVYPIRMVGATPQAAINPPTVETIGWPEFASAVAQIYRQLPEPERATAVIFTANYGQAGALARYGQDLAPAYSGHNAFWRWGPPPDSRTGPVIVVGHFREERLKERCGELTLVRRWDNGFGADNEEQGAGFWICRQLRGTWSQIWPELRHLS